MKPVSASYTMSRRTDEIRMLLLIHNTNTVNGEIQHKNNCLHNSFELDLNGRWREKFLMKAKSVFIENLHLPRHIYLFLHEICLIL